MEEKQIEELSGDLKPDFIPLIRCPRCGGQIQAENVFCPHCGERQRFGAPWYYRPLWIAVLAFLVLGPLAFPLIWWSPALGRRGKWMFSAALLIYTVYVGYLLYRIVQWELQLFHEMNSMLN